MRNDSEGWKTDLEPLEFVFKFKQTDQAISLQNGQIQELLLHRSYENFKHLFKNSINMAIRSGKKGGLQPDSVLFLSMSKK